MSGLAERQSVTNRFCSPAVSSAATRLWSGAKSVSVASCRASGAQTKVAMPSPSAENARSRIEGNSSATQFGAVHLGSRGVEFEGSPAARCASSLANAATISLAVAAARAGHRKGVKATKAHRRYNRQTVQRAQARAARQLVGTRLTSLASLTVAATS